MKKVLFLINTLQGGGAEKVLVDTVNSLNHKKYDITVQTLFDEGIYQKDLAEDVTYKTVISCRNNLLRRVIGKLLFQILPMEFVYKRFIQADYDYEIAFLEGLPTKVLSRSTNRHAKILAWVHTDLLEFPGSYYAFGTEEAEGRAYRRFDRVFCVSNAVKESLLKKYELNRETVFTLYNILDNVGIVKKASEEVSLPTNIRPCLISVGRLSQEKGYDRLLRVHKRLIEDGYIHSLLILGEGTKREELEEYILANKLDNTVYLLGFQANPYKYISKADLFICSSYAEGFSTVVSESVLCGTPVISTEVAGAREPAQCPRCSAVIENDEPALYEALLEVLRNPSILNEYKTELPVRQIQLRKETVIMEFERSVFTDEE